MNVSTASKTSQTSHTSPASANKPASSHGAKTEGPAPKQNQSSHDAVSFSDEAQEIAAVDPSVCKNDWRCLQALDLRGLLA